MTGRVDEFAGQRPVTELDARPPLPEPAAPAPRRQRVTVRRVLILLLALGLSALGVLAALHVRASRRRRGAQAPIATVLDPRPRLLRAVLSAIDLRRRPPWVVEHNQDGLTGALRALRRPPAPRLLPYVTIKRTNPRVGDTFGHWWVEIDGTESYGWWPHRCPIRIRDFFLGGHGTLNGMGGSCSGGTTMTDPHHLEPADHSFHPTLVVRKSDRRVRADVRAFAQRSTGGWRWSTKPISDECRSFQLRLLETVGLEEGDEHVHTRGPGCPFLALFRPRLRAFSTGAGTGR
ncbi:MAG: hypothetical protein ACRDZ1_03695 [Acidimicrobiia bacterium]